MRGRSTAGARTASRRGRPPPQRAARGARLQHVQQQRGGHLDGDRAVVGGDHERTRRAPAARQVRQHAAQQLLQLRAALPRLVPEAGRQQACAAAGGVALQTAHFYRATSIRVELEAGRRRACAAACGRCNRLPSNSKSRGEPKMRLAMCAAHQASMAVKRGVRPAHNTLKLRALKYQERAHPPL